MRRVLMAFVCALLALAPAAGAGAQGARGTLLSAGQQLTPALKVWTDQAVYAPYQPIQVRYDGMPLGKLAEIWIESASVPGTTEAASNMQFVKSRGTAVFDGIAQPGRYAVRVALVSPSVLVYEYDFTVGTAAAGNTATTGPPAAGGGAAACATTTDQGARSTLFAAGRQLTPALQVTTDYAVYAPYQPIQVRYDGMPLGKLAEIWIEPASVPGTTEAASNMQFMNSRGTAVFDGIAQPGRYAVRVAVVSPSVLVYEYDFTVGTASKAGGKGQGAHCAGAAAAVGPAHKNAGRLTTEGRQLTPSLKVWTDRAAFAPYQKITVHYSGMPSEMQGEIWIEPASVPLAPVAAPNMQFTKGRGTAVFDGFAQPGRYAVRVMALNASAPVVVDQTIITVGAAHKATTRKGTSRRRAGKKGR